MSEERQDPASDAGHSVERGAGRPLHPRLVQELVRAIEKRMTGRDDAELDSPMEVEALLRDALRERATDIHVDSHADGVLVRMRIDGVVLDGAFIDREEGHRLGNQIKTMARLSPVTRFVPEDGRISHVFDGSMMDIRVTHVACIHGDKLSIRLFDIPAEPHHLHELGLYSSGLERIHDWLDNVSGMLLVAGPTGSGKTTTLYALLHKLRLHERNIMTIEDPVEYQVDGINHIQVDHTHGLGFSEGVKAMLRLDPDYLMVGEIRDRESAGAALTAAGSGHALMSTMHARDAVAVIETLRNFGLNGHEISANLMLVVAQRLVRKLCEHCRAEDEAPEEDRKWLAEMERELPKHVWLPVGCEHCRDLGFHGRTGVFEVWRIDAAEYQMILNGADRRTLYRHLAERGHVFLLDDGLAKVEKGITCISELRGMGGLSALGGIDRRA